MAEYRAYYSELLAEWDKQMHIKDTFMDEKAKLEYRIREGYGMDPNDSFQNMDMFLGNNIEVRKRNEYLKVEEGKKRVAELELRIEALKNQQNNVRNKKRINSGKNEDNNEKAKLLQTKLSEWQAHEKNYERKVNIVKPYFRNFVYDKQLQKVSYNDLITDFLPNKKEVY